MKIKDFVKLNKRSVGLVITDIIMTILIVVALIISTETHPFAYVAGGIIIGVNLCTICYNVVDLVTSWRKSK